MMKTLNQMLKQMTGFEFPENFMELAQEIKIKDFTTEADKGLLTLYGQIEVEDEESLKAIEELITPMITMLKEIGVKRNETQETKDNP